MRTIKFSLIAMLLMAAFVVMLTGCGRKGLININGEKIGKDDFYSRLERVPVQTVKGGQAVTEPAGQYVIEQIITENLLQQLAKKENVAPTDAQIEAKLKYLKARSGGSFVQELRKQGITQEDWKRQMKIQQSVINLMSKGVKVSDADAKKIYNDTLSHTPNPFTHPAAVHISVIIAKDQNKINKAYKLLEDKQEFSTVAMRLSEDKATRLSGGTVGWLSADMKLVPPTIRKVAFATPVGTYSKPVYVADQKESGWVIIKNDQARKATTEKFNDVKLLLKEQLAIKQANQDKFNTMIKNYINESKITVNAERYKKIPDMLKKTAGSVPTNLQPGANPTAAPAK